MHELGEVSPELLAPVTKVLEEVLPRVEELDSEQVMVVGAWCRDIWHHALGHSFDTTRTHDLDLALALTSWTAFDVIADAYPRVGDTGIRFRIAGMTVDVLPFGAVEDPTGTAQPSTRGEDMSVWAFTEIFEQSLPLPVPEGNSVRIPTVPGFTAAKLGAWLDRSAWHETRDAADLALALHWYAESSAIQDRLYESPEGSEVLVTESMDVELAAARLLGHDVAFAIGPDRLGELLDRWPGDADVLARELIVRGGGPGSIALQRRSDILGALTRGLSAAS